MMDVTIDIRDLHRLANDTWPGFERQVPYAISRSLLDMARDVRDDLVAEMQQKFNRVTPFVVSGMLVQAPHKDEVRAGVMEAKVYANANPAGVGMPAARVLEPHLIGGGRRQKRSERRVGAYLAPASGATLDEYGNIQGEEMVQILSALGAASGSGYEANRTERSKLRNKGLRAFFRRGDVIYERKGKTVRPVLALISTPAYQPVLDWQNRATAVVQARYYGHFLHRMEGAVATAHS